MTNKMSCVLLSYPKVSFFASPNKKSLPATVQNAQTAKQNEIEMGEVQESHPTPP